MGKGYWVNEEDGCLTHFEPAGHKATRHYSDKQWKEANSYSKIVKSRTKSSRASSSRSSKSSGDGCGLIDLIFSLLGLAFSIIAGIFSLIRNLFKFLGAKLDESVKNEESNKKTCSENKPHESALSKSEESFNKSVIRKKARIEKKLNEFKEKNASDTGKFATFFICLLFGFFGAHRFYVKRKLEGWISFGVSVFIITISVVFTEASWAGIVCGTCSTFLFFWWIIDFLAIIFGKYKDNEKKPVIRTWKKGGYMSAKVCELD